MSKTLTKIIKKDEFLYLNDNGVHVAKWQPQFSLKQATYARASGWICQVWRDGRYQGSFRDGQIFGPGHLTFSYQAKVVWLNQNSILPVF